MNDNPEQKTVARGRRGIGWDGMLEARVANSWGV